MLQADFQKNTSRIILKDYIIDKEFESTILNYVKQLGQLRN